MQPDYRWPLRLADRCRYLQERLLAGERQSERRGCHHHAAQLEEVSSGNPASLEVFFYRRML
jgi:hypothetical protein